MTLKIAHMSDLHYSAGNLQEADRCFTAAVTEALNTNVDCVIITGDTTDHALDAHAPATRALAAQIKRLSDHCPVLMLQGTFSHEPPGFLRLLALVGGKYPVTVADRIASFGLSAHAFVPMQDGGSYRLVVHALPTLNKAAIAALVDNRVDEAAVHARQIISGVLERWGPVNDALRQRGIPSMVISHGTVFNSISESGVPMAGTDHELGLGSLFAAKADGVALGHIHKQQSWEQETLGFHQVVAYAGSIGRFHHGEIGDKYWLLWSLDAAGAMLKTCPTPSRRNVDLVYEGAPDLDDLRQRISECEGAFVRIRYCIDEESRQNVDRAAIRSILEKAADVQIEGKTLTVQRQRAQGISTQPLGEKLATWAKVTETDGVNALRARLELIQSQPVDEVVQEVLKLAPVQTLAPPELIS